MIKYLFIIGSVFLIMRGANAQYVAPVDYNPFSNLKFSYGPTDTVSFIVSYNHIIGNISQKSMDMLSLISGNSGENFRRIKYAIGFTIPGYPQTFYAPCKDNAQFNTLSSQQNTINKLRISCVVYRFYRMDIISNFFYVNKVNVVNE
jgi:hypothetical protein